MKYKGTKEWVQNPLGDIVVAEYL